MQIPNSLSGSHNVIVPCSRRWKFGNPSLHRFWHIHPCDERTDYWQTDERTELRWL